MSKKLSLVLMSILCAVIVVFCIFAFLPSFEYGAYGKYYSPFSLIQLGTEFTDTSRGTFRVKTDILDDAGDAFDDAAKRQTEKIISQRLSSVYGYHNTKVWFSADGKTLFVDLPETTRHDGETAENIVSNISSRGLFEIIKDSTYSSDSVVLTNNDADEKHFSRASLSIYVDGGQTYYIVNLRMTNEGFEAASKGLTASGSTSNASGYISLDESVLSSTFLVLWTSQTSKDLTVYCGTKTQADLLISFATGSPLPIELFEIKTETIENSGVVGIVVAIVFSVFLVGLVVVSYIRYGFLSISMLLSILLTLFAITWFAGLVYFNVLNMWAVIGAILGFTLLGFGHANYFEKLKNGIADGKTIKYACGQAYAKTWLLNLIANGAVLVLGIVLWLIPTAVTASLGCALVLISAMSLVCTFGLNLVLSRYFIPAAIGDNEKLYGVKKD